jgi:hypothetical protein
VCGCGRHCASAPDAPRAHPGRHAARRRAQGILRRFCGVVGLPLLMCTTTLLTHASKEGLQQLAHALTGCKPRLEAARSHGSQCAQRRSASRCGRSLLIPHRHPYAVGIDFPLLIVLYCTGHTKISVQPSNCSYMVTTPPRPAYPQHQDANEPGVCTHDAVQKPTPHCLQGCATACGGISGTQAVCARV